MKTTLLRTLLAVGLSLGVLTARAAMSPADATVLKVTGNATATIPGQAAPQPLRVAQKLPQGAVITTAAGASVLIQPFAGAVTTVNENTTVTLEKLSTEANSSGKLTRQTALLNLKSGNVVSTLDPEKNDVNDFGVSTPKGVAAARGTQFTTSVTAADGTVISANADTVQFTQPDGSTVTISHGNVTVIPANAPANFKPEVLSLASLATSTSPVALAAKAAVQAGVTAMASVISGNLGNLSTAATSKLANQIVAVATTAEPTKAGAITSQIVSAVVSSAKTGSDVSDTVAGVVAAAAKAAPDQVTAIASQAITGIKNDTDPTATTADKNNATNAVVTALLKVNTPGVSKSDIISSATGAAAGSTLTGAIVTAIQSTTGLSNIEKTSLIVTVGAVSGKDTTTINNEVNNAVGIVAPSTSSIQSTGGDTNPVVFPTQPNTNTENTTITQ